MPELPDVTVYVEALQKRLVGQSLTKMRLASPFVLRTVEPSPSEVAGRRVTDIRRLGKRIVMELEGELFIVIHLMIAGRFKWLPANAKIPGKLGLAAFDFPNGTLLLTEAGSKRRASIHIVRGAAGLKEHDRGGLDPLAMTLAEFSDALTGERHTLKRSLTDPGLFSGIGNAYSDEILHRARLSPVQLSTNLSEEEIARLYDATGVVACHVALKEGGALAIWATGPDAGYLRRLQRSGFDASAVRVAPRPGAGGRKHVVFVAVKTPTRCSGTATGRTG